MKTLAELIIDMSIDEYELLQGDISCPIESVAYDSRKAGPGSLFICIPGAVSDGHDYIPQVLEAGTTALVTSHDTDDLIPNNVTVLRVKDPRHALAMIAAAWFEYPAERLITIGITGTKGKTTTTYMIRDILEDAQIPCGLIGTIEIICGGEHIPAKNTTPESWIVQEYFAKMADAGLKAVVMEVSSQALKMSRVDGIMFDYGIFTNLEKDHIGENEHPDMEDYIACKSRLFRQCRTGIFNADADYLDGILAGHTCRVLTYGIENPADYRAGNIEPVHDQGFPGVEYDLTVREDVPVHVTVDIPGDFTVYNSLAAAALCRCMGIDDADILAALEKVRVKGRMEIVPTPGEYVLMIDYAHNAMALEALLKNLRSYAKGRLICCFGCGGNRSKDRRYEMGEVSSKLADLSVVTSDNPRFEEPADIIADILVGVKKGGGEYIMIEDRKEAIRWCMKNGRKGDLIVLAGKGHEDYQEIRGVKYPMDERVLVREIIEEEGM
ncbi:MAG: UDP-N-acetylmuramoyl-L-alanyl-D-glutamate--2,6-diaminopimelate ligase [Lachnospiraceae bacterium]|nr:UDP-N-acetylmuramoyl-L-alanyl-D-glutamate--2,6-diaminopimelate ligase [Lachnospiraceae bacterium]